jgi:hypothetical protein
MYKDGYDLYDHGGNIALSNMTYIVLRSLLPENTFREILKRFQIMMRNRTLRNYKLFWNLLYEIYHGSPDPEHPIPQIITYLLGAEMKLGFKHLSYLPEHQLDIAVTCSLLTINHWRTKSEESFEVIHDRSSSMAKEKWIWDAIVNPNVENCMVGYDRRKMKFPLNVEKTLLADSKDHIQLQIADLLAGASFSLIRNKLEPQSECKYFEELEEAGINEFFIGGLWPTKDVTPESLGTLGDNLGDPNEFIGNLIKNGES